MPITKTEYTLKDLFQFVSMIDKQDHSSFISSFDIDNLLTNVFGRKRKINGLTKSDFQDLLQLNLYVDDTFVLLKFENHVNNLLFDLNSKTSKYQIYM